MLALGAFSASATLIYSVQQDGNNVVVECSGSLNLSGMTLSGSSSSQSGIRGDDAILSVGPNISGDYYRVNSGYTGTGPIGSGTFYTAANANSGDAVFFNYWSGIAVVVDSGYVSGGELLGTATFNSKTIADLGLTAGQYNYSWGSGSTADSITVNVGVVPEPATAGLLGISVGALWLVRRLKKAMNYYRT